MFSLEENTTTLIFSKISYRFGFTNTITIVGSFTFYFLDDKFLIFISLQKTDFIVLLFGLRRNGHN